MSVPRWALGGLACALTPPVLLGFGSPPGIALAASLGVLAIALRSGSGNALTLVGSCAVALAMYGAALRVAGLDEAIYYRFHERFATWDARHGHRAYRPGVSFRGREPYGDLQIFARETIAEPRDVEFRTDADGFRNDADYAGQPWVLVGDSFVVGVANSQQDILQARLAQRGVRAYNLGHPGGPLDYESFWRSFQRRHRAAARPLLFLFEGNDFPETVGAHEPPRWWAALDHQVRGATARFTRLATYRVTRSLVSRFAARDDIRDGRQVLVLPLAGARQAFFTREVVHARAPELQDMALTDAAFARLAPDLAAVFFIPTKYRVYQPWVAPGERLPDASWRHLERLCDEYAVRCFDLTPALVRRSEALLAAGRFTWWRDDTHWNGEGIDAAAARVAEVLGTLGTVPRP
jgi:hypothetical protein